jgi:hypothetical protein
MSFPICAVRFPDGSQSKSWKVFWLEIGRIWLKMCLWRGGTKAFLLYFYR